MYAAVIQAMATDQIRRHHATAAATGRARQIRQARRRGRAGRDDPAGPPRPHQVPA
ncbi:MAG: hypothetical protein ACLPKI_14155 [Streptosporangiaceae bacterium]